MLLARLQPPGEEREGLDGRGAVDDRPVLDSGRERPEGATPVAGKTRGTEGVGYGLIAMTDQEGTLEGQCHSFHDPAGPCFEGLG